MTWQASLSLAYTTQTRIGQAHTTARFQHTGPLRILQSLYPEGPGICHNVLVHPPGGLVGGDTLDLEVSVADGAHGLITTPGATRFYRSEGAPALQRSHLRLAGNARLEWLPLESIAYSGCMAENRITMELAPSAQLMGWDITALGLPAANAPFERGRYQQHLELPGVWLERGRIAADDERLLNSPAGLAGHRCLATLFWVCGSEISRARRERALELARALLPQLGTDLAAGATAPNAQVVAMRVLSPLVEPAMRLLKAVRNAWRVNLWGLPATQPRVWST